MSLIKYCIRCATPVSRQIPAGDQVIRAICPDCGHIHYENPHLIVGCVAEWQGRILLCRRAIEPRLGYWTLPAGFMENGETTTEAAVRETLEEAGARIIDCHPFALVSIARIHQVHLFYRAQLADIEIAAGSESLEVSLLDEAEIPWSEMAFRSGEFCLRQYFSDRARGHFGFHSTDLDPLSIDPHHPSETPSPTV